MHRWFFANERETCVEPVAEAATTQDDSEKDEASHEEVASTSIWPFCLHFENPLHGNECLAIVGNCPILGNWHPEGAFIMTKDPLSECTYRAEIEIPRDYDVKYRYLIIGWNPHKEEIVVRFWEAHAKPRVITTCQNLLTPCDVFGLQSEYKVNRAHVFFETYLHLKVFNAPFIWPCGLNERLLYVRITPVFAIETPKCREDDKEMPRISALSCSTDRALCEKIAMSTEFAFAEVSTLSNEKLNKIADQPQFGTRCGPDDLVLFHLTISNMSATHYRIDLYTYAYKAASDEPPYYFGYGQIRPEQLVGSEGSMQLKITCASTHRPLCQMKIGYVLIKPLPKCAVSLERSYAEYCRQSEPAFEIGRRGCGATYQYNDDLVRENTLHSINRAAEHGADMVELDVMLTNEGLPVVHHDHVVRVLHRPSVPIEELIKEHDIILFPMADFTLKQLRQMAGYCSRTESRIAFQDFQHAELRKCKVFRFASGNAGVLQCETMLQEQSPFPLLSEVIDKTTPSVSLLVEVKWVQRDCNNRWQENGFKPRFDRNYYVDQILETTLTNINDRAVIFCSFDVDICIMLRFKQNRYPIMLITSDPLRPVQFKDKRVRDFNSAVYTAEALELYGLLVHCNRLLNNSSIMTLLNEHNLTGFSYGAPMNELAQRVHAKANDFTGIMYDRIDQLNQAGTTLKPQFFMLETTYNKALFERLYLAELAAKCGFRRSRLPSERRSTRERPKSVWTFCVYCDEEILPDNAYFAISGNCEVLGNWQAKAAVTMSKAKPESRVWRAELQIPRDIVVLYRFFIYVRDPIMEDDLIHIRYWETFTNPRMIQPHQHCCKEALRFGWLGKINKIQRGWLLSNQTQIFFKLFNAPFYWSDSGHITVFDVKLTRITNVCTDSSETTLEMPPLSQFSFCEVATLSSPTKCTFAAQPALGTRCGASELVIFCVTVCNQHLPLTEYRFDLITPSLLQSEQPKHFGCGIIMPNQLTLSQGSIDVPIKTLKTLRADCTMRVEYVMAKPWSRVDEFCTLEHSKEHCWRKEEGVLRIGRAGCGLTYLDSDDNMVRCNTIYSFKRAERSGADMVELDVMLTADKQPVINLPHVLEVERSAKKTITEMLDTNDLFSLPMEDFPIEELNHVQHARQSLSRLIFPFNSLTLSQLRRIRGLRFAEGPEHNTSLSDMLLEQMPFALLEDVMKEIDDDLGMLIEIKRVQKLTDNEWEGPGFPPKFDINFYLDTILDVVMPLGEKKRIIFSSYDCDTCMLLRQKQNFYPVLLMSPNIETQVTYKNPCLQVPRNMIYTATALELLGLELHVSLVLQNSALLNTIKENNLVAFAYGKPLMMRETRTKLILMGAKGLIFSGIDQLDSLDTPTYSELYILETNDNKEELDMIYARELQKRCKIRSEYKSSKQTQSYIKKQNLN